MINDFYTTLFTVKRLEWTEDEDYNQYSVIASVGSFSGHIQQASPELTQSLGLSFSKTFTIWCAVDEDVEEGDVLDSAEGEYLVKAVQKNNLGANAHLELVVEYNKDSQS